MKIRLFILNLLLISSLHIQAQQQEVFNEYLQEAKGNATLFVGQIEDGYSRTAYANTPYWGESEETYKGEVCFDGKIYPDVELRYDTYIKQLIIINPNNKQAIMPQMHRISYFTLNDLLFEKIGEDFAAVIYHSPEMKLVKQQYSYPGPVVIRDMISYKEFTHRITYLLVMPDGSINEVKNRKSVISLFPNYKKELKQYAKENRLDFGNTERQSALKALIAYANQLINTEKP